MVCCDCELDFVKFWQVNLKFKGKIALKFAKLLTKFITTLLFKDFVLECQISVICVQFSVCCYLKTKVFK